MKAEVAAIYAWPVAAITARLQASPFSPASRRLPTRPPVSAVGRDILSAPPHGACSGPQAGLQQSPRNDVDDRKDLEQLAVRGRLNL
jgi:hypothetical protein